jgi:penicillin-binding protein 2
MDLGFEETERSEQVRVRVLLALVLAALGFMLASLWRVQVHGKEEYRESLERQSIRRVRLPAARGRIMDRNGACLARNRANFRIVLYVEELRKPGRIENTVREADRVLTQAAAAVGLERTITVDDIRSHLQRRSLLPLVVWRDVDDAGLARFAERANGLPGLDVDVEPVRFYPRGKTAGHVLGYIGRAEVVEEDEEGNRYHYVLPDLEGKVGIEARWNETLAGTSGGSLVRVGASGFKYAEESRREPQPGLNVRLTLDARLQGLAENLLEGREGAVVLMDVTHGDVLVMASSPGYDPNAFSPFISTEAWSALVEDKSLPLMNRAVSGVYAPGSTFKPIVALAALTAVPDLVERRYTCDGAFALGSASFGCWQRAGHGTLGLLKAIEQSCNVYFCQIGLLCEHEAIARMAGRFGLGRVTGLSLDGERPGLVPDDAWKRRRIGEGWRAGDTCNFSIGQGFVGVTPLQMAACTAALGNGGFVPRPRLVLDPPEPERRTPTGVPAEALALVREGMRRVIEDDEGSGRRARVEGIPMGGKTGTAQYGSRAERKYTWMAAFAPFDHPRYAAAIVVEEGESGGLTCAPMMHDLMEGILRPEAGGGPPAGRTP